jgi:hypothetical protein
MFGEVSTKFLENWPQGGQKEDNMPLPMEARITAAVLRDAIAGGSLKEALDLFGEKLSPEQRTALSQINDVELAALRSLASKRLDLPGDKLA